MLTPPPASKKIDANRPEPENEEEQKVPTLKDVLGLNESQIGQDEVSSFVQNSGWGQ